VLEGHHSRSVLPQRIRLLYARQSTGMAGQGQAWWCHGCARWCKAKATHCEDCGVRWDAQRSRTHSYQWRPSSPRQRQKSPRRRKGDGKGKGEMKGEGKGSGQQLPLPPTAPSSSKGGSGRQGPPKVPAPTDTTPPPPTSQQAAETQLAALLGALTANKEALPDSLKEVLVAHEETATATKAKKMHKAVASQASCQKQLTALRTRRDKYLQGWQQYLTDLIASLEGHIEEKQNILADFAATEEALLDTMEAAREKVLEMAGEGVKQEPVDLMDTEAMGVTLPPAPKTTAPAVAPAPASSTRLAAPPSMENDDTKLLTALRRAREDVIAEAAEAKRERTPRRSKTDTVPIVSVSDDEQGL